MNLLNSQESGSYSVHELTRLVEVSLSKPELQNISVIGEIIEYTCASSGHIYFTLSDKALNFKREMISFKKSILRCTFFERYNQNLKFEPKVGDEIQVVGLIRLYYSGGLYNFDVRSLHRVGEGNLFLQIQELRQRLIKERVIDPSKRKKIPILPKKIGIITGMKTAALKDIFKQIMDRYPHINLLIVPAYMQGKFSRDSIAKALSHLSQKKYNCDIILLSRGGGSVEDLMSFNDEKVARAMFECKVPIISGIGHESDHPIADDVADMVGATPTDAAKIALPIVADLLLSLEGVGLRLSQRLKGTFELLQEKLKRLSLSPSFQEPLSIIESYQHRLDDIEVRLVNTLGEKLNILSGVLTLLPDIYYIFGQLINRNQKRYTILEQKLLGFSPLAILKRGYSITQQYGKIIRSIQAIDKRNKLELEFYDGKVEVKVVE